MIGCGYALSAQAAAPSWRLDPANSRLSFTAQQGEAQFTGGFKTFTAEIQFHPDDLPHSHITARVQIASVFAGAAERDQALPTPGWLNTAQFPEAIFTSTSITALGSDAKSANGLAGNHYLAKGTLTLKGVTKPLELPFAFVQPDHIQAQWVLQRQDYGIGTGAFATDAWVKFPVTVTLDLRATPTTPLSPPISAPANQLTTPQK
jgi:polyisoprenoid-binding protein YceI